MPSSKRPLNPIHPKIVKRLLQKGPARQSQLAADLALSAGSLRAGLKSLQKGGLVRLEPGDPGAGDPMVSLLDKENCVIGLDLGGTKLYGAITDMAGSLLAETQIYNHGKSGEACYEMLAGMLHSLLGEAARLGVKIRGISVQVPGRVNLESGVVLRAPAVKFENFPLKQRLVSEFKCPVFADNDLKQSALGEAWFGAGQGYSQVALVAIGTGIAAGVVADDVLQRGANLRHGEIGWMVPSKEYLGKKYSGFGPFEVEASGPGIANRARAALRGVRSESELANLSSEDVFNAARQGEGWARQVVDDTIDFLAILFANVVAFYDPDVIILSGGISRSSDMLIEPIRELISGCVLTQPEIVVSTLGYRAGVLGALANLVLNCPDFYLPIPLSS